MALASSVTFPPPAKPQAVLVLTGAAVCWYVALDAAAMLYRDVWLRACAGIGLLDPVVAWYDRAARSMMTTATGLALTTCWLGLWWSLRPTRRRDRWGLALSVPALAMAVGTVFLLQPVAVHAQRRAVAVLTVTMQPTVDALEQGRQPDDDELRAAGQRLRAVLPELPELPVGRDFTMPAVVYERPEDSGGALLPDNALIVRRGGYWLAYDPERRAWRTRQEWLSRPHAR